MKKFAVLLLMSFSVFAAPKDQLSQRLQKNAGFSAGFAQQVISPEGDVVMQGKGSVDIARPSLFRWTTSVPDDTLLVSDGKSVWYYSPFVDQVTIYWQKQAMAQTPFILLTRNRASDWDNYRVEQQGDTFTLTPTAADSNQGQFKIIIDSKGAVQGFSVIEQDGQQSKFVFSHIDLTKPSAERFKFVVPDGVEVDDQRN